MKRINLTPTWAELMPVIIRALKDHKMPVKAKKGFELELLYLAKRVDELNGDAPKKKRSKK